MQFKIAYTYTTYGEITVEADSLEEAKEIAYEESANNTKEWMLDETFEVDEQATGELNELE
jgi:uncharacterized membrane protein YkoI